MGGYKQLAPLNIECRTKHSDNYISSSDFKASDFQACCESKSYLELQRTG